ncbi:MAG: enoyl-CoA hydratase/isomerase family protein [Bacteroidales bacterium]|nr:enoyl-CoA hydratase/isomerase family protein [Bacteroidales bacterium]
MLKLKKIEIERNGKIATLWLNQPEIRNSLNPILLNDLIKSFHWLEKQDEIVVVFLRGRGNSFCAGADINWMIQSGQQGIIKNYLDSKNLSRCFKKIYHSNKVVINLVHGHCFGGGLGFIGTGDFSFALNKAVFALPEVRLGLAPAVILPYLLTRATLNNIKYKIFTGNSFTAEEALQMGVVDGIYENMEEMEREIQVLVESILAVSPNALAKEKILLRSLNKSHVNKASIRKSVKIITQLKLSEDARARMSKFITKK